MKKGNPYVYAGFTIFAWSSTAAIVKLLLQSLSTLQVMFFSFLISIITLFGIIVIQKKTKLFQKYNQTDYLRMAGLGFLGCYAYYVLLLGAFAIAPAQEVFIINYLWPIMVVLFAALLLKEKLGTVKLAGVILGFAGVYVVMTQGNILGATFVNLRAAILAAFAAIMYSLFSVLGKKYKYETFILMFIAYVAGFALVAATLPFFGGIPFIGIREFAGLVWLGVMANSLAYVSWFKALELGDTAKMANAIFLTPFVSLVWIYVLVGENIRVSSIVGLAFIVMGIVIQSKTKPQQAAGYHKNRQKVLTQP